MNDEPKQDTTKAKYQNIFGMYSQGLSPQEIKAKTGYSYTVIKRAVIYCKRRWAFDKPEQIEIAISIKEKRLADSHNRLDEFRTGWTEQKVEKLNDKTIKQTATKKFSHGSEIKLMSLIRDLDNDLNVLRGLLDMRLKGRIDKDGNIDLEASRGTFLDFMKDEDKET